LPAPSSRATSAPRDLTRPGQPSPRSPARARSSSCRRAHLMMRPKPLLPTAKTRPPIHRLPTATSAPPAATSPLWAVHIEPTPPPGACPNGPERCGRSTLPTSTKAGGCRPSPELAARRRRGARGRGLRAAAPRNCHHTPTSPSPPHCQDAPSNPLRPTPKARPRAVASPLPPPAPPPALHTRISGRGPRRRHVGRSPSAVPPPARPRVLPPRHSISVGLRAVSAVPPLPPGRKVAAVVGGGALALAPRKFPARHGTARYLLLLLRSPGASRTVPLLLSRPSRATAPRALRQRPPSWALPLSRQVRSVPQSATGQITSRSRDLTAQRPSLHVKVSSSKSAQLQSRASPEELRGGRHPRRPSSSARRRSPTWS